MLDLQAIRSRLRQVPGGFQTRFEMPDRNSMGSGTSVGKQRAEIFDTALMAINSISETDGEAHHLIAHRAHDFSGLADGLQSRSGVFAGPQ